MSELVTVSADAPDEAVVRHYLMALSNGKLLDALNAFSMDAQLRDGTGRERHGIREIAAAFASQERPVRVDIEDLRKEGGTVAVRVRMTFPKDHEPRAYRGVFRVSRERIRSLILDPVPTSRTRRGQVAQSS